MTESRIGLRTSTLPPGPDEARGSTRIQYVCLAWIENEVGDPRSESASGIARTVDLSSRGVGLILSREFSPMSRVGVEFLLPETLRLRAAGIVMHCVPLEHGQFRVGVRFDAPPHLVDHVDDLPGDLAAQPTRDP